MLNHIKKTSMKSIGFSKKRNSVEYCGHLSIKLERDNQKE